MMSEIVLVISNKPGVEGINRARRAGILALVIELKILFFKCEV